MTQRSSFPPRMDASGADWITSHKLSCTQTNKQTNKITTCGGFNTRYEISCWQPAKSKTYRQCI